MKRILSILMLTGLVWSIPALGVHAQRGVGESRGIASRADTLDVLTFTGRVVAVVTEPCQATTGRASTGTHFLLRTSADEIRNIHLGPAGEVAELADQLSVNRKVIVDCFRTPNMQANHYVANSVKFGKRTVELRDQSLRPVWAGSISAATKQGWSNATWQGRRVGGRGPRRARGWRYGERPGPASRSNRP
jgi:hypothetical protein